MTCARSRSCRPWSSAIRWRSISNSGLIYNDILEKTGASSATISRVNRSLQYGNGGYEIVFARLRELAEKASEEQA